MMFGSPLLVELLAGGQQAERLVGHGRGPATRSGEASAASVQASARAPSKASVETW